MLQPAPRPRQVTPRRSSASQGHLAFPFPAPILGLDTTKPMPGGNPMSALRLENLVPRALGCQLRPGYTRWVSQLGGEVISFLKYNPATGDNQLFAANSLGEIFNVTIAQTSAFTPTPVLTVTGGFPPGEWSSLNFVNEFGAHILVAVNPGGGYWTFDGAAWTEHLAGDGTGGTIGSDPLELTPADPKKFSFVTVYQRHLIFIEMGSTKAWYLPVGQMSGVATSFDFGPLFPNGGQLSGLVNWTFDGGSAGGTGAVGGGMDTKLVVIATQGDVIVYQGRLEVGANEPAEFRMVGRWYIGRVPVGHRYFSQFSADVAILSERGMVFMTELMRGEGFFGRSQTALQINIDLARAITNSLLVKYWEVDFIPHDQLIVIKPPKQGPTDLQWAYEVNNKAFCTLTGIPMVTLDSFNGRAYSGDLNGNVWHVFEGQSDGSVDAVAGKDLQGVCVTTFQALGEGMRVKRFLMVRPSFISDSAPGVMAQLNSNWNVGAPDLVPAYLAAGESFWGSGHWDVAVWSGSGQSYESWIGAAGTGRYGSLALRVRGAANTLFVGWQAVVEQGGVL